MLLRIHIIPYFYQSKVATAPPNAEELLGIVIKIKCQVNYYKKNKEICPSS